MDLSRSEWLLVDPAWPVVLRQRLLDLADRLQRPGGPRLSVSAGKPDHGEVLLEIGPPVAGVPAQGYRLTGRGHGIRLEAGDPDGVFYGFCTLAQLFRRSAAGIPEFTIEDHPDFPRRGVMLDVSRGKVPTLSSLLETIDLLAGLKINALQLYIKHTFAFSAHETVWRGCSPLTPKDILVLDAYCRDRFIDLVPYFASFGHFEPWLVHPEYRHLAECPDGFSLPWGHHSPHGSVLKPNRESLRFLDRLYAEFLPNFSSAAFNVGCDETWELGQGWSRKRCEQRGKHRVYLNYLVALNRLVQRYGRRMMFWGDIILHQPELISELPGDVVALDWGYEAKHPFAKQTALFAASGIPFHVCPGTSSWNALIGRTENCLQNLDSAALHGFRNGAVGYLNTDWGDGGHHQYPPFSYLGFAAGAALSWNRAANRGADWVAVLNHLFFDDASGTLGHVVYELGRVLERLAPRPPNSTIFNRLLFWKQSAPLPCREELNVPDLQAGLRRLAEIASWLELAQPRAADGPLVVDEIRNAIGMARIGLQRGLRALTGTPGITPLRNEMRQVIAEHERLWQVRNRSGGLHESSGRLRTVLADLT